MKITDILNAQENQLKQRIIDIENAELRSRTNTQNNAANVIKAIHANPQQEVNFEILFEAFHGTVAVDALAAVLDHRTLTNVELTDFLLDELCRQNFLRKTEHCELAERLFNSAVDQDIKIKMALFATQYFSIIDIAPSAAKYLSAQVNLTEAQEAPNKLIIDTKNYCNKKTVKFRLEFTESNQTGLEDIAEGLLNLVSMGYQSSFISVSEEQFGKDGYYCLDISQSSSNIYTVCSGAQTLFQSTETEQKASLVEALQYIANNTWFTSNTDDQDSPELIPSIKI